MKLAPVPSTAQGMPEVPVLAIPEKLAGIWDPMRYKVMYGGAAAASRGPWRPCCW